MVLEEGLGHGQAKMTYGKVKIVIWIKRDMDFWGKKI